MNSDTPTAFPLAWPAGWPRTPHPGPSRFDVTLDHARTELRWEIERLGGNYMLLSTNLPIGRQGHPLSGRAQPADTGVAVYFNLRGRQMVFACDRWNRVEDNVRAIQKTVEALRGIERWGASSLLERALTAFTALPAPRSCWDILGIKQGASQDEVEQAYRHKAKMAHPDVGGSTQAMAELNKAREEALK